MRREFSAGGVLVRRARAAAGWLRRSARRAARRGSGRCRRAGSTRGEAGEATALREIAEETGARGRSLGKLGDVRYWFNWEGERVFKVVSFFLVRYEGGRLGDIPEEFRHEVAEVRWLPLDGLAARPLAYAGEREMAVKARLAGRLGGEDV